MVVVLPQSPSAQRTLTLSGISMVKPSSSRLTESDILSSKALDAETWSDYTHCYKVNLTRKTALLMNQGVLVRKVMDEYFLNLTDSVSSVQDEQMEQTIVHLHGLAELRERITHVR